MPHKDNPMLKLFSDLCINTFRNILFKPNRATVIFNAKQKNKGV